MPREVLEFRAVVASPSDLFETRKAIFEVLDELDRSFENQRVAIRGLGWEEYVTPAIGSSAQDVVNQQLLAEYDILIAIFATKLGTPTANASSGTVEEIENAIANTSSPMGKYRVQVYFRDKLDSTATLSIDEFKRVIEYREALKPRGILFALFKDRDDLQREVRINVQRSILEFLKNRESSLALAIDHKVDGQDRLVKKAANDGAHISEEEELGLLDYQEKAELALQTSNNSMTRMTELIAEIGVELNRNVAEISDASFVSLPTTAKKAAINSLAHFIKAKSAELEQEARAASEGFDVFASAIIPVAELQRQTNSQNYQEELTAFLAGAENMLVNIAESRASTLDFRRAIENVPRITIQFNQAKKSLMHATDECIKVFDHAEKSIYEITART